MEEDGVILSDSDEDCKPLGTRSKKRKIDSDSEDEYEPPSFKRTNKIKTAGTKSTVSEKPKKNRTAAKERKPKATIKRSAKETKVVKEENKNEVFIYLSMGKLYVYLKLGHDHFLPCPLHFIIH
jgi:hypothetical protein